MRRESPVLLVSYVEVEMKNALAVVSQLKITMAYYNNTAWFFAARILVEVLRGHICTHTVIKDSRLTDFTFLQFSKSLGKQVLIKFGEKVNLVDENRVFYEQFIKKTYLIYEFVTQSRPLNVAYKS